MTILVSATRLLLLSAFLAAFTPGGPAARADQATGKPPAASSSSRFEKEIAAFEAADRKSPPPPGGVLFIGDSGIRMWKNVAKDFPDKKVINRGFGGSQMADSVYFADRIVIPYRPSLILIRAGGNDLTAGKTPEQIVGDLKAFVEKVRAKLPEVRVAVFSTNPNPTRWAQAEQRKKLNALFKEFTAAGTNLDYIEIWDQFLDGQGKPRTDIFLKDGLHNNAEGYKLMAEIVRPHLK